MSIARSQQPDSINKLKSFNLPEQIYITESTAEDLGAYQIGQFVVTMPDLPFYPDVEVQSDMLLITSQTKVSKPSMRGPSE